MKKRLRVPWVLLFPLLIVAVMIYFLSYSRDPEDIKADPDSRPRKSTGWQWGDTMQETKKTSSED